MQKISNKIKLLIFLVIIVVIVWFVVINPMLTFNQNEKKLEDAARRYFELNQNELPSGERIKTLSLKTLYHKSFLENDLYIPYTKKSCSIEKSWVKVRRENNEIKYYVNLDCGILKSKIDSKGPKIVLNGKEKMTLNLGEKYKEPGVKSVTDNKDGKLETKNVTIKGSVDENKIGTYEITYTAFDSLKNKTVVTRKVNVIKQLNKTVEGLLQDRQNFTGNPTNNYVSLSNMLFRIFSLDDNKNVVLVSDEDIANVNYTKIDKWLKYYYNHLTDEAKKLIVEKEYCNMQLDEDKLETTECTSFTEKKKVYIPSVIEVNKAKEEDSNYMKPNTMSWLANPKNDKEAYLTRYLFFDDAMGKDFLPYDVKHNYGVRPMLTIKGDILINTGDGTIENPYIIDKKEIAKGGTNVNERYTGEYLAIDGIKYRIIEPLADGTTKIIAEDTVGTLQDPIDTTANQSSDYIVYDVKDKESVAYFINNKMSKYIDVSHFDNHEIEAPIYKGDIIYGKEIKNKKMKAVLSAPNMYEMFSAQPQRERDTYSYWLNNTSQKERTAGGIFTVGVPLNQTIPYYMPLQIRVVAFLKKGTIISNGKGTFESPYVIK